MLESVEVKPTITMRYVILSFFSLRVEVNSEIPYSDVEIVCLEIRHQIAGRRNGCVV